VAFEDSVQGLTAAKAAGLFTVATPTRWTRAHDLSAADVLFPHLGDPEAPLDAGDAARAAGAYLTLERLVALHGSARR
jgi:beta-phosphoglucomutase-like phosphatase (HAD superfamily)